MITLAASTTIMVPVKLKKELDALKGHHRESYAEVISKLVARVKPLSKKEKEALMKEYYTKYAKENAALCEEMEPASAEANRLLDDY